MEDPFLPWNSLCQIIIFNEEFDVISLAHASTQNHFFKITQQYSLNRKPVTEQAKSA